MRIGVYICHCGLNIAGVLDPADLAKFAESLPDVAVARDLQFTCSDTGQETIKGDIKEHKLDSVVVAACSPRLHEPTFRRVISDGGLNPYMLEMANIREQCSWVHMNEPAQAQEKARDLVRMSVAKAMLLHPLESETIPISRDVLIIGGGVAGIQGALDLADSGIHVYMVERKPTIGGYMALLTDVFPTNDCSICVLAPKMSDVYNHPLITLLSYSEILNIEGSIGRFTVSGIKKARFVDENLCKGCINDCSDVCPVEVPDEYSFGLGKRKAIYMPIPQSVPLLACIDPEACVGCGLCEEACPADAIKYDQQPEDFRFDVGAIIVATGWQPFDASRKEEFGYGRYRDVITGLQMERLLNVAGPTGGDIVKPSNSEVAKSIAFLQCVGSRDATVGNAYCSRVCCMYALKNAQLAKEKYPDAEIAIHYIDMRAGGEGYEEYYQRAQRLGIKFIRGRVSEVEEVDGELYLNYEDTLLGKFQRKHCDLVCLSAGLEANQDADVVGKLLGLSKRPDGFFEIAHPKMRPVEAHIDGVFIAGCASGPKEIQVSIAQGEAAAAKAMRLVLRGELTLDPMTAMVDTDKCIGCKLCVEICPSKAISVEKTAYVDEAVCKGCGTCAAACPVDAINMRLFSDEQIVSQVRAATAVRAEYPFIVGFLCNWCSYAGADLAGTSRIQYPTNMRVIRVMCVGRVDPSFVIEALKNGADGVLISGCRLGECHYTNGNHKAYQRIQVLRGVLEKVGIDPGRVKIIWCAASEGEILAEEVRQFVAELKEIGPIGSELKLGSGSVSESELVSETDPETIPKPDPEAKLEPKTPLDPAGGGE